MTSGNDDKPHVNRTRITLLPREFHSSHNTGDFYSSLHPFLVSDEHILCMVLPEREEQDESEVNAALAGVLWLRDEADRDRCLMDSARELARTQAMVPGQSRRLGSVSAAGRNGEP